MIRDPYLRQLFESLDPVGSADDETLRGARIPDRPSDYVARRVDGAPVILFAVRKAAAPPPSINLRYLKVDFSAHCRIRDPDLVDGHFVMITCGSEEPGLHGIFLDVCQAIVAALPLEPSVNVLKEHVASLTELFTRLSEPPRRAVKGVWAELLTILVSQDPEKWVRAWRVTAQEKFDFSFSDLHIEVKATEKPQRVHEFSLEQLCPTQGAACFIGSILVRESSNGVTVPELAWRVAESVGHQSNLVAKIWRNVLEDLGAAYLEGSELRYDEAFAKQNLKFIDSELVPRPIVDSPNVFGVRFSVDLSSCPDRGLHRIASILS